MRPDSDVHRVFELWSQGVRRVDICRATGLPWSTVRKWIAAGRETVLESPMRVARRGAANCAQDRCALRDTMPWEAYAYLLGLYLGDGHIVRVGRSWRLSISCCDDWPGVREEAAAAVQVVVPHNSVNSRKLKGMHDVYAYSNHWLCLIPQHGPGDRRSVEILDQFVGPKY